MKTHARTHFQRTADGLLLLHTRISTWVAKLIGPMVFDYGTKEKGWNLSTCELLAYPEDSLGKALGRFLDRYKLEPLAGAEYHDVQHVLLDYSISFKDEVALQFFLHGNGKRSIASVSTMIGAWLLLPHEWKYLRSSYAKGKRCNDLSSLDLRLLLSQDLDQAKSLLYNKAAA